MKILAILGAHHPDAMALLEGRDDIEVRVVEEAHPSEDRILGAITGAHGIAVRSARLDGQHLAHAPNLAVVSRHGVGCDSIDVPYLSDRGLPMAIAVGGNDRSVAEHTLAMILMMARDRTAQTDALRAKDWTVRERHRAFDIAEKTLLVVGYGRIGRRVAALAGAFGMRILANDPYVSDFVPGVDVAGSLAEGLDQADIVTVHTPLNAETRGLINAEGLQRLRPGALVINNARGGIVDEPAMAAALTSGHIAGYGTDVFSIEPVQTDNPILSAPNTVMTPHAAAMTPEGMRSMGMLCIQNVLDAFDGRLSPEMMFNRKELGL
ncbi:MAG: hydroxyacid dehydrogenase [Pseudomonadota bacterium]